MMKKILALCLSLTSVSAFAADAMAKEHFAFTFFGNTAGRYTMVACSYAEDVATRTMEKFGAKDVYVSCTGGIQPWGISPLNLQVQYDAPNLDGETKSEKVTLESDSWGSNCDFDTSLVRALLRDFPNVKKIRGNYHCFNSDSRYEYEFEVKMPFLRH